MADADDFVIGPDRGGPGWHLESIAYEIFPDRFTSSGAKRRAGLGGSARVGRAADGSRPETQCRMVRRRPAGHRAAARPHRVAGANLIYLTPIFPAGTIHRYDSTTFERIDPLLGGDEGLVTLTRAAHERGMRVIGDLTLNHVGSGHEWFTAAPSRSRRAEHGFFYFD